MFLRSFDFKVNVNNVPTSTPPRAIASVFAWFFFFFFFFFFSLETILDLHRRVTASLDLQNSTELEIPPIESLHAACLQNSEPRPRTDRKPDVHLYCAAKALIRVPGLAGPLPAGQTPPPLLFFFLSFVPAAVLLPSLENGRPAGSQRYARRPKMFGNDVSLHTRSRKQMMFKQATTVPADGIFFFYLSYRRPRFIRLDTFPPLPK